MLPKMVAFAIGIVVCGSMLFLVHSSAAAEEATSKQRENEELRKEMEKLEKIVANLVQKIAKMEEAQMVKMNEAFEGLEAAFETKMRKLLEQKTDKEMLANLTGGINGMEFVQMKNNNKWNAADCGPKLDISEGGLFVKHSGKNGYNCIRAISPISPFNSNATNPSIAGYYEVQFVHKIPGRLFPIGFCTQQFPLEGGVIGDLDGSEANSIGIFYKGGMHIARKLKEFSKETDEEFDAGDVVGIGIIHFPGNRSMKCFATCNGQLLGTVELPANFLSLELFPAATLRYAGDSIRANFGQQKWLFDPSQLLK